MRAVAFSRSLPVADPNSLVDVDIDRPRPGPRDLLVRVEAVSVNPVDTKVRRGGDPAEGRRVLGFDAAGTVAEVGNAVTLFKPGDNVFYAGSIARPGSNSEYHLVDERVVGPMPRTIGFAEAAAVPLTGLTAHELIFDRIGMRRDPGERRSVLVIGGAGGVGSMAIQLLARFTGATIVATASRPETANWCRELGAQHVVDHSRPMAAVMTELGIAVADVILALTGTRQHAAILADLVAPQGRIGFIEGGNAMDDLDRGKLFQKSASIHLEFMFTPSFFLDAVGPRQHETLTMIADAIDAGSIRSTATEVLRPINAANLRRAHQIVESGRTRGKIVLAGWAG
jgi:zinc-binding alcohol dehydrogenase family protein